MESIGISMQERVRLYPLNTAERNDGRQGWVSHYACLMEVQLCYILYIHDDKEQHIDKRLDK